MNLVGLGQPFPGPGDPGVGLTMVDQFKFSQVANHVFLLDPWWNPACEMQAGSGSRILALRLRSHEKKCLFSDSFWATFISEVDLYPYHPTGFPKLVIPSDTLQKYPKVPNIQYIYIY